MALPPESGLHSVLTSAAKQQGAGDLEQKCPESVLLKSC